VFINKTAIIEAVDTFIKQTRVDWRRYHRIADRAAPKVFRAFNSATAKLSLSVSVNEVTRALELRDNVNALENANWEQFEQDIKDLPLTKPFFDGAEMAIDELIKDPQLSQLALEGVRKVSTAEGLEIKTAFTLRQFEAERFLAANQEFLASSIMIESKEAVRQVILNGFETGKAPRVMAREIKGMIGLNASQSQALINLETTLNTRQAKGLGWPPRKIGLKQTPLTDDRIDNLLTRSNKKMLRQRAEMLSRTESIRSANAGSQATWENAVSQGFLPSTVRKIWQSALDERTCPFCNSLHGTTVELKQSFSTSVENESGGIVTINEPHPPAHVLCRCSVSLEIDSPAPTTGSNLFVNAVTAAEILAGNREASEPL